MKITFIRTLTLSFLVSIVMVQTDETATITSVTDHIFAPETMQLSLQENQPAQIKDRNHTITLSAQNSQIGCDLDEVIFQKDWAGIGWQIIKKSHHGFRILGHAFVDVVKYPFTKEKGEGIKVINDLRNLKGNAGGAYAQRLNEYRESFGEIVDEVAQQKYLTPGIYKVVLALKANGFILRVASNQNAKEVAIHRNRFPELFELIDDGTTVDYIKNPAIKKPNQAYFEQHIKTYNIKSVVYNPTGKYIGIFIDDKEENVQAAAEAGMIGIQFVSTKQLVKDLRALGLPTPSQLNDF